MVKEINLKDLFPDCESIGAADVSEYNWKTGEVVEYNEDEEEE